MTFIVLFLILIVPDVFADRIHHIISLRREENNVFNALIFSLIIYLINIIGLFLFHRIYTFTMLIVAFDGLRFMRNYILLSLLIATNLGISAGFVRRWFFWIRH